MKKIIEDWVRKEAIQRLKSKQLRHTVKIIGRGHFDTKGDVKLHWKYVSKLGEHFYISELVEERELSKEQGHSKELRVEHPESEKRTINLFQEKIYIDVDGENNFTQEWNQAQRDIRSQDILLYGFESRAPYDRHKAVHYAERWWNSRNPAYPSFKDNCTNYISQCLAAGRFPMTGFGQKNKGWWFRNGNFSYSWVIAHALQLYLAGSKFTREVKSAEQLALGDIICYDFEGDGRFNHNTIVTGRDGAGQPLVNANTYDSRQRFWEYTDSSAYTPNIRYRFFHILD